MRLGVLDVGSNTVHLLVVDAYRGGRPAPAHAEKVDLQLTTLLGPDGAVTEAGEERLRDAVSAARRAADGHRVEDLVAFATSALRDAPNGADVVARVGAATGVPLEVLAGADEARLTFLAVRRWFGWSAGRLLVADIGGGSLEVAAGEHEEPELALSFALGAARMHGAFLAAADPVPPAVADALAAHARASLAPLAARGDDPPDLAVATSKTFRTLARIAGARKTLDHAALRDVVQRLRGTTAAERAGLPGVSPARAPQLLAGAIVAEAVLDVLGLPAVTLCPWALREGVILRRLDWLAGV